MRMPLVALLTLAPVICSASPIEPTFYFGSEYRGESDSPVRPQYLEDFEDGDLSLPGVTVFSGYDPLLIPVSVSYPSEFTNSVDGGHAGHSFAPSVYQTDLGIPEHFRSGLKFIFDDKEIGALPTFVGLAITRVSSPSVATLEFFVYGADGEQVGAFTASLTDLTVDTPFLGVAYDGISAVHMVVRTVDAISAFQIDHLQFAVPEPSTGALAIIATLLTAGFSLRRR